MLIRGAVLLGDVIHVHVSGILHFVVIKYANLIYIAPNTNLHQTPNSRIR